jgi:integrase/recombinase XerD
MSEEGRILFNPAEDVEFPRTEYRLPKNILNEKEYARLVRSIRGRRPGAIRDRLIFNLLYMTGIRKAELTGIMLSDIDYEHSALRIGNAKGGKVRFIPLLPRTIRMIRRYIEQARPELLRGKESDMLLINNSAKPLQPRITPNKYLLRYLKSAGIRKKITIHSFRHSFATALLKNGAPIRHIQRLLGHDTIKTTLIYTHLSIEDLKKAHHKFHPFENGIAKEATP